MPVQPAYNLIHAPEHDSSSDKSSVEAAARLLDSLPVAMDITGMWNDEVAATSWAVDSAWPACKQSTELVVMQVCLAAVA